MYRRPVPLGLVVWIVIGVIVAAAHHYFDTLSSVGPILSAIVAVILWPLVLFGVKFAIAVTTH
jgi:ABC-type anion transport system duplicated permease subunit